MTREQRDNRAWTKWSFICSLRRADDMSTKQVAAASFSLPHMCVGTARSAQKWQQPNVTWKTRACTPIHLHAWTCVHHTRVAGAGRAPVARDRCSRVQQSNRPQDAPQVAIPQGSSPSSQGGPAGCPEAQKRTQGRQWIVYNDSSVRGANMDAITASSARTTHATTTTTATARPQTRAVTPS